jgi:hypothetical protein
VCSEAQNQIYALVIGLPLLLALVILRLAWERAEESKGPRRRKGKEKNGKKEDDADEEEEEEEYEVDSQGSYVYGISGFRLFPVTTAAASSGTLCKIPVGPVGMERKPKKTFHFDKSGTFPSSSIFSCSLEHPIGVTFERTKTGRVVIAEIAPKTDAWRQSQVARLNQDAKAPKVGDVLRACSSINFFYSGQALFGIKPPERTVVMYGVDKTQSWSQVCNAITKTQTADGKNEPRVLGYHFYHDYSLGAFS